jgi:hypothetical protein
MGGNRLDAFVVKVPSQKLMGTAPATPPATDTTGPAISTVSAPLIGTSSATITWATNESSDSQVEYGTTASYGSATQSGSMVTSHSQALSQLAANTLYHYRVKSRDTTGNLATSADGTFTTVAVTSPPPPPAPATSAVSVSISAPSAEAIVTGKITISASASADLGVAGVQFKIDGKNFSSENTTAPYSVTWNAANYASGFHTLNAVVRDKAGHLSTSAPIRVTVKGGRKRGDRIQPKVSLTAPAAGATVSGTIAVSANAADNKGMGGVQFKLDGVTLGAEDTVAPYYSISWDTTTAADGLHTLTAVVRDAVGNIRSSAPISVTVNNTGGPAGSSPPVFSVQNVIWTNGVNVSVNGNSLQKTGGCGGCTDAGAVSQQQITSGNGYVEFTASETTTQRALGLSTGNSNNARSEIDFAIMLWQGNNAEIYENDVYRAGTSYTMGDVFRIAVESGVVKYYKNGSVFYTSAFAPGYPSLVDTSLWSAGSSLTNVVIGAVH